MNEDIKTLRPRDYNYAEERTNFKLPTECNKGDIFKVLGLFTIFQNDNQTIRYGNLCFIDDNYKAIYRLYKVGKFENEVIYEFERCVLFDEYSKSDFQVEDDYFLEKDIFTGWNILAKDGYLQTNSTSDFVELIHTGDGKFIILRSSGELVRSTSDLDS